MTDLPDRSVVRTEIAALLTGNLTGPSKLAQVVYSYTVKDFKGKMPALVLGSAGTDQKSFTLRGSRPSYLIDLWVFVLYSSVDQQGAQVIDPLTNLPVWSEQDSERCLDQLEAAIRELLDGAPKGASYKAISYASPTTVDITPVGDQSYRRELIPLRVDTF